MHKKVIAQFFIMPEHVSEFMELTKVLIKETRKESGCLFYNLYQSLEDATSFIFYENYVDQKAFDFHLSSAHFAAFDSAIKTIQAKELVLEVM